MPFARILLTVAILALAVSGLHAQDRDDAEFFERRVRPLLTDQCIRCHGPQKQKGGLRLDSRIGWQRGGDGGAALLAGDVEHSRLIRAVRYRDPELQMPPDGRLPDDQIAVLEEWVRRGAPDPRDTETAAEVHHGVDFEAARKHWAFQALPAEVAPPAVHDAQWPLDPLDRFVLARLEQEGLAPAADADRRTWIRRVALDLTGLPPSPEEVEAFVHDSGADAFERVVDRLLDSPEYGERQARWWLDLARYADSNGLDENLAFANAWRYRDAIVRAFNRDQPYDEFVTWQVAGDLLPPCADPELDRDRLAATAFLALGPKMLAEQDKDKLVADVIDEQIDVVSKSVLGLTVSCGRCHDHKFDPIPQRDYYALGGIFRSTSTLDDLGHVSRWRELDLSTPAETAARAQWDHDSKHVDESLAALQTRASQSADVAIRSRLGSHLLAALSAARRAIWFRGTDMLRSNLIVDRNQWGTARTPVVRTGSGGKQEAEWEFDVARPGRYELQVRFAAKESRPVRLLLDGVALADRALAETTGDWFVKDQRWHPVTTADLGAGRHVLRLERGESIPHIDRFAWVPSDGAPWPCETTLDAGVVRALADGLAAADAAQDAVFGPLLDFAKLPEDDFTARSVDVTAALQGSIAHGERRVAPLIAALLQQDAPRSLRELCTRYGVLLGVVDHAWRNLREGRKDGEGPTALPDAEQEQVRVAMLGDGGLLATRQALLERDWPPALRDEAGALRAERKRLDEHRPEEAPSCPGVADGAPMDIPIHLRGNHLTPAKESTPRGALQILEHCLPQPRIDGGSGRLALARWLVDPRNPLTPRVIVNRLWQTHFGRGLAPQTSNFGLRGEAPSHPELLDALARDFVAGGMSIKRAHRRIVLSRTYRQSSHPSELALAKDPEDVLLGRFPQRRLEAEAIRDSMLAVSGRLDRTLGGTLLGTKNRDYVTNDQSGNHARYDAPRRTLYLPVIRNALVDVLALFDYGDPSVSNAARPRTAVATQALWLMNSPFVLDTALAFARRLLREEGDDRLRIDRCYRTALGRPATEHEIDRALAFVQRAQAEHDASNAASSGGEGAPSPREIGLGLFCQAVMCSNEFLGIE